MIGKLYRVWPQPGPLLRVWLLTGAMAVLQGLLLGLLVPILRALLRAEPDFAAATPWLVTGAVGLLVYGALSVIVMPVTFTAHMALASQLRQHLMRHVTTLPLGWFTGQRKGKFVRTVTNVTGVLAQLTVTVGAEALTGVLVPVTIVAVTFVVDWRLAIPLLATVPLALLALRRSWRTTASVSDDMEVAANEVAGRAIEFGQAQPVLRAAGHGTTGTARMREALDDHRERYRRGLRRMLFPDLSYSGVVMAGYAVVLVLAVQFLLNGSLVAVDTIALLVLAVRFVEPLGGTIDHASGLGAMDYLATRVENLQRTPTLPHSPNPVRRVEEASIEFSHVTFSYGEKPALSDVSFRCPAGTTTALVGPSGSGKTTVTRLVARFFDVDSGSVRVGGVDVREYDHPALLSDIAIVFQDVYLFDTTIEENLRLANPDATREELEAAARAARLDEVVERLPDGWNTRVGEGGMQLSGGERQRVSIARAFLKRARIVLIDEAASALDPENEGAVSQAIVNLARDPQRTVIVIAHRPATLAAADHVVALDAGRVTETGSPTELLRTGGTFARLYNQYEHARSWHVTT
ncbi:ATP-binding cassette, subfamily B [Streptoalloteichus tenebrarius]|uniref:ATP-binding cassette, subfamily B n=1 Tax=Streptoalloteichus tenebrarius (strain ATCC 17920 / DSM 40477 / JCM 4838 / CBS 697.72 / NBRC 16177 / NCIMB 11028 / NRRL B-12390 / A12253. 1 / ISP 5477) TaxID=1933 RepID=A0ABT1HLI6_STRSD|nr:ABC transporter ATP-binding protein [Streptoalloteichus tenebrarius]MCP2256382.1 ATP-binding cassette, subfamily B [Streptoalloteichus tenebrarius]BFF04727.1 ABC transporter ATP-binding protein [Streptoalloteichus tenebrarius]